jgi:prevent-host-death family protein
LSALIDSVKSTDEEVIITKNGVPAAVLVSPDEFETWRETIATRSDADLMQEIKDGLSALKQKKAKLHTLDVRCSTFKALHDERSSRATGHGTRPQGQTLCAFPVRCAVAACRSPVERP